jgi:hypothetical protein
MRKATILAAGIALIATSAFAQSSWRDRDDDRRGWREERRDDRHEGRDRHDMRGRSMGDEEDGGRSRAARFFVRSGDARMAVRCDDRESMRACVDATLTLYDRIRTQAATSGPASSASPGASSSPSSPPPAR